MIIHTANALAEASQKLEVILHKVSLRNIAWRGHFGALYYEETERYSRSLASLASLAKNDVELCYLASGWQLARLKILDEEKSNLVIVVSDLSAKLLCALRDLHLSNVQATVILLDASSNFIDQNNYPGILARCEGLTYPPPLSLEDKDEVSQQLKNFSGKSGIKIIHLLNFTENRTATNPPLLHYSNSNHRQLSNKNQTLERVSLRRMAEDLQCYPKVNCIWASAQDPSPFDILAEKLQVASVDGVIIRAIGVATSGFHPLVVISAADVPRIINDLLKTPPFPITILLVDAGLLNNEEELPPANRCDLALLRVINNLTIGVPTDEEEARSMLLTLLSLDTPSILRLSSSASIGLEAKEKDSLECTFQGRCLCRGEDLSFICLGSCVYCAMLAAHTLHSWGVSAAVYSMDWLNPLDENLLQQAAQCKKIITVEEHSCHGALATAVMEFLQANSLNEVKLKTLGIREDVSSNNLEDHGLSMEGLLEMAKDILSHR